MHIDKARQAAEEKAKREQEDAAAQAAKGKGG
jgi:hypothetical protein